MEPITNHDDLRRTLDLVIAELMGILNDLENHSMDDNMTYIKDALNMLGKVGTPMMAFEHLLESICDTHKIKSKDLFGSMSLHYYPRGIANFSYDSKANKEEAERMLASIINPVHAPFTENRVLKEDGSETTWLTAEHKPFNFSVTAFFHDKKEVETV